MTLLCTAKNGENIFSKSILLLRGQFGGLNSLLIVWVWAHYGASLLLSFPNVSNASQHIFTLEGGSDYLLNKFVLKVLTCSILILTLGGLPLVGQGTKWKLQEDGRSHARRSGVSYDWQKLVSWISLRPFSISASMLKDTSSVWCCCKVFYTSFPLPHVSAWLPITPSPWPYHSAICIVNCMFQKRRISHRAGISCIIPWNKLWIPQKSVKLYLKGFCGIGADNEACPIIFLVATQFNCIFIVPIIYTQFITA